MAAAEFGPFRKCVDLGDAVWALRASFAESGMAKAEGAFPKKKLKGERVAVRDRMAQAWVAGGWQSPGRWPGASK